MAYHRKEGYRKKDWRKSGWAKAAEVGLRAGSHLVPGGELAYSAVGALTGFNTEKKYYDKQGSTALTSGFLNGGGGLILTDIQQGDSGYERAGISVRVNDFQIRFIITPSATIPTSTRQHVRVVLLYDREGNVNPGSSPGLSDVFQDTTTSVNRMFSPLNVTNFGRFQILKDEVYTYNPTNLEQTHSMVHDWKFGEEVFKEHHLEWASDPLHLPPENTPTKGHIFLYAVWSNWGYNVNGVDGDFTTDVTTNNGVYLNYYSRCRFVDN